jgi:hypothetical protein
VQKFGYELKAFLGIAVSTFLADDEAFVSVVYPLR